MAEVSQSTVSAHRGGELIRRTVRSVAMFAVALVVASAAVVSTGVLTASAASTGPGSLDTSFNAGGSGTNSQVSSVAVQSDGKILIGGGFTTYNGGAVTGIARLNADGSRDESFNSGGVGANSDVYAVAMQADGKVLIGGYFTSYNGTSVGRIARLNADGSLDASFNPGGVGADLVVYSVVVQPDGKILIGGRFLHYNGTSVVRVARLNSDGSVDASFNPGGAGANDQVSSMAVQSDGKIVLGGAFTTYNGNQAGGVVRVNADGSADATFNPGGAGANSEVSSVVVQSDGKLLIGGLFASYNGTSAGRVARLNSDGSLDTTFNSGGVGANSDVNVVAVQSDGKLLIGGRFTSYDGTSVTYLAHLNMDGSLDTAFNAGGAGANYYGYVQSVAMQADGKILIGGRFTAYNDEPVSAGIARLSVSAVPHTVSFGANGGSGSMVPQSASAATALSANTLTRSGYTFSGWNTAADGSGTAYADGAVFPFTANATLYAQWAAVPHTASFDANGGSGSMASQSASAATALSANTFTRSGYTFTGWNTAADGSGTAYADQAVFPFTADATLYALWAAVPHTVSFDANGGSGSMVSQSASSATALNANTLTRSGFTFSGWNTAADGSGTGYADGAVFPFAADATLYAQWAAVPHTVSFGANGGSGSMASQSASAATALSANALSRSGFTFSGWNTAADGSGTACADQAVFPFTADTTLYAQWAPVPTAALQVTLGLALGQPVTGGSVSMSATGLLPGSSWQAVVRSTPVTMASGVVLSDGTFTSSGVLPSGLEAGTHSVTLTATSLQGAPVSSVVWFQVSAAGTLLAVTTDSSVAAAWVLPTASLAITGSDSVDGLLLGTLLLLAGGLLLVLRRRRRATA